MNTTLLTPPQARQIIDLFGPCSTVYECTTPEEMATEYEEGKTVYGESDETSRPWKSHREFILSLLSLEAEMLERMGIAGPTRAKQMVKEMKGRLKAAGLI